MTSPLSPRAIGVDGAPGGWVAAMIDSGGRIEIEFVESFAAVLAEAAPADVVVVDMPIGLSSDGNRPVDALVRERLGTRRATFFPTPVRSVLDLPSWEEANLYSKHVSGKGLSKQAWNLIPKIIEVDECWDAVDAGQLREGHPETSFAEMSGAPLATKKARAEGREERLLLLQKALPADVRALIESCPKRWITDAIDALALAWTAQRVLAGEAVELGGERDDAGRPMELCI